MYINRRLKTALDFLGKDYSIKTIDLEQCLYRDLHNGFDIEISGVKTPSKGNVCNNIWVWDLRNGAHTVENTNDIKTLEELKAALDKLCKKYGVSQCDI